MKHELCLYFMYSVLQSGLVDIVIIVKNYIPKS